MKGVGTGSVRGNDAESASTLVSTAIAASNNAFGASVTVTLSDVSLSFARSDGTRSHDIVNPHLLIAFDSTASDEQETLNKHAPPNGSVKRQNLLPTSSWRRTYFPGHVHPSLSIVYLREPSSPVEEEEGLEQ